MENDFVTWLNSEIELRGWNGTELARRSDMTPATVSNVLNRLRGPGIDFCVGIARALKMPPEDILRRAGLIPSLPPDDETLNAIYTYSRLLSPIVREQVLDYIKFLYSKIE